MAPRVAKPPWRRNSLPAIRRHFRDNAVHANGPWAEAAFARGQHQQPHSHSVAKYKWLPRDYFRGYTYSGHVNLSGVTSFSDAAATIRAALNQNLQVAAVTAGSSITPESVSFTGYFDRAQLYVTSVSSGSIEIGGMISGHGIAPGSQIISQLSGTPGGAGQYTFFHRHRECFTSETMTETYGVLTVGAVNSGTVAVGQEVTGAGVLPLTAIDANLSGSGPGSTWLVDNAQTVAGDHHNDGDSPPGPLGLE